MDIFHHILKLTLGCILCIFSMIGNAQTTFYSDSFNGGVIGGGFSLGDATFGTGSFTINIPAGSTIRQAYLFGTSITDPGAYTISLNGDPYTFDNSNLVQTFNTSIGLGSIHAIDVTNFILPTTTGYSIMANFENQVSEFYSEFYLYIAYDNPTMINMSTYIYLNDQPMQSTNSYTLNTTQPISSNVPTGLAFIGGYADGNASTTDCQNVSVAGNLLGSFFGADNNAASSFGALASFNYGNVILSGLGDDSSDQKISGADVLSNIQGIIPNNSTSFVVDIEHCTPTADDNILWMMLLNFSDDTCTVRNINLGNDTSVCVGKSVDINAKINANATYQWSDGSTDTNIIITLPDTYSVEIRVNSCFYGDTIIVNPTPAPSLSVISDTSLCLGDSVALDISYNTIDPSITTYNWSDGTVGPLIQLSSGGTYQVTISVEGCINTASVDVTVNNPPFISLPQDSTICSDHQIEISLSNNYDYVWNDGVGGSYRILSESGTYEVVAENNCGTDTASINVIKTECNCIIYIPNSFSPNNDGVNDYFVTKTECPLVYYEMIIFNRWGEEVFVSNDIEISWNGLDGRAILGQGLYTYRLQYASIYNAKIQEKTGSIVLFKD